MNKVIENIRAELIRNADEKVRQSGERFFKATMPRTSLRYSTEKMPAELKAKAMSK